MVSYANVHVKYLNKIFTIIFSALFIISLYVVQVAPTVIVCFLLFFTFLNIINFSSKSYISAYVEIVIFEIIAILGMYLISWYYVLLLVIIADIVHFFNSKKLLVGMIAFNSLIYLVLYGVFYYGGNLRELYPWQAIVLLFVALGLSIYFVEVDENYKEIATDLTKDNEEVDYKQKYFELLKQHSDIILLKEIMEISNKQVDINEMLSKINEELVSNYENIDYITIFIYDEKRKNFSIVVSNVSNHLHKTLSNIDQFEEFEGVICDKSCEVLNSDVGLTYPTAVDRGIMSTLCVPLHTVKDLIGLILLESQTPYAFEDLDINQFNLVRYNISLIVENKRWVDKIERMALVDGLTGVYNRNYLFDFLLRQMKWHKDNSKKLSLVMFDIDHFKKFNDTYGHLFGDLVLKEVSKLVKESIREADLVARYGGEEFIIIFVDTDKEYAFERTEQIRIAIQDMTVRNEEGVSAKVTVSFGIAEFGETSYNINDKELIERADQSLYCSKDNGRNRVTVYDNQVGR